ncbi:MAG: MBL fold metallo-hydrolase [Alphaproteobacteria bacterium]|nr:MBL fold metallo-hydrolase [Alphaproteobacteria bacterium]
MPKLKSFPDTQIDEIAPDIYRINTGIGGDAIPGGFSFNRYLIKDDAPLVFHTGLRGHFEATRAAIESVMPIRRLRYIAFSHFEADECGALNELLAAAPESVPVCSAVGAMVSVGDQANRVPSSMTDGTKLELGKHSLRWLDTPHLPHGWDCGYMFDETTKTLFCGDVFTQPGSETPALTESDILEPSEAMRKGLDYFAHGRDTTALLEKLAATQPKTLACMHGSAWTGDGAALLRELGKRLD